MLNAFGQIIVTQGIYEAGMPGGSESRRNDIQSDGSIGSWNGLTGSAIVGADVYNCAAVLTPITESSGAPRFIIIGGGDFADNAVADVFVNTAP